MWCDLRKSSVTVVLTGLVISSAVVSNPVFAARQHHGYAPHEFRDVLKGLGYDVKGGSGPLTDDEVTKAITAFQKGYKLTIDGKANPETEKHAALIVKILQSNLNLVLKPANRLPRDKFYGHHVEELVKEYQKKNQLKETGIADLALRQKLDQEAKTILSNSATQSDSSTMAKPKATPKPKSMSKPMVSPTATPTSQP